MPDPPLLSIALLARDEIGHLGACLESVAAWSAPPAGELVIVLDDRAPKEMEALARHYTPHVSRSRFVNFSAQRNRALEGCHGAWVFFIDPDERATPALVAELRALLADPAGLGG